MSNLSRNELKQKAESLGIEFKANANKSDLEKLIKEHNEKSNQVSTDAGQNNDDAQIVDGFDDANADDSNGNGSNQAENDSDDEVVAKDTKNDCGANMNDLENDDIPLKTCAGNFSDYPDTDAYFPSRFNGRYSVDFLRTKKLIK